VAVIGGRSDSRGSPSLRHCAPIPKTTLTGSPAPRRRICWFGTYPPVVGR